jgi:hypothetical protein
MNFLSVSIFAFAIMAHATAASVIKTKNTSSSEDKTWRKIGIEISNPGTDSINLDTMKIVYKVKDISTNLLSSIWYFQAHNFDWKYNIQGVSYIFSEISADSESNNIKKITINFVNGAVLPAGGSLEIQFGIHRKDYSSMDQISDPSYIESYQYVTNSNVQFIGRTVNNITDSTSSKYYSYNDTGVLGKDMNGNGIRDDIDAFINDSVQLNDTARVLLQNKAKLLNLLITSASDTQSVIRIENSYIKSAYCFSSYSIEKGATIEAISRISNRIFAKQMNSIRRVSAYFTTRKILAGQVFKIPSDEFDIATCLEGE